MWKSNIFPILLYDLSLFSCLPSNLKRVNMQILMKWWGYIFISSSVQPSWNFHFKPSLRVSKGWWLLWLTITILAFLQLQSTQNDRKWHTVERKNFIIELFPAQKLFFLAILWLTINPIETLFSQPPSPFLPPILPDFCP